MPPTDVHACCSPQPARAGLPASLLHRRWNIPPTNFPRTGTIAQRGWQRGDFTGVRGAGWLQWEPSDPPPRDGPGHSGAGLGTDAHLGSGSEQRNAATRSLTRGFGEASGFGLTHKHLPCRWATRARWARGQPHRSPEMKASCPGRQNSSFGEMGQFPHSTAKEWNGDRVWWDGKDGVPITQSRTQVGLCCKGTHCLQAEEARESSVPLYLLRCKSTAHNGVVLVYTEDSPRQGLLPGPSRHHQLCRAGGWRLSKLLLSEGGWRIPLPALRAPRSAAGRGTRQELQTRRWLPAGGTGTSSSRHHLQLHFLINVLPNFPWLPALPLSVTLLITDVSLHRGKREEKLFFQGDSWARAILLKVPIIGAELSSHDECTCQEPAAAGGEREGERWWDGGTRFLAPLLPPPALLLL